MNTAYIVGACRTPGGKVKKGNFKNKRPDELAAAVISDLIKRTGINAEEIDDVILGCAFPEAEQGMNFARLSSLRAGVPFQVPAQTLNRFCSSGLQTIVHAAESIISGHSDCIIAGGAESMTCVPMLGNEFSANHVLVDNWPEVYASMGVTAEMVAEKHEVTREQMDAFAVASHQKAAKAIDDGLFDEEIVPIEIEKTKLVDSQIERQTEVITKDEGVRRNASVNKLAKLRPAFKKNGTVTAGNASQMSDGASATLVVSEAFLKKNNLTPLARFVSYGVRGVPPEYMGIGPIEAIPRALKVAGLKLEDIGAIELNEAFASQALAVIDQLKINPEIVNTSGGAIALGHPLGCTGAKLTTTLLHEMKRNNTKYGMVSMCIGGGMGAAGIFELQ